MSSPRPFKPYSVGTTPQPLIGTTFTNAIIASPNAQQVAVQDSSMFLSNDQIICVPAAGGGPTELALQITVVNSTTISAVFTKNHNAGEYAVLDYPCQSIQVQAVNAHPLTNSLFIGGDNPVVTTAAVNAIFDLYLTNYYSGPPGFTNGDNTSSYWVVAASGTQYYLPSAVQC